MNTAHRGRKLRNAVIPVPPPTPFTIATPSPLPAGTEQIQYSQQLESTATHTPVAWSLWSGSQPPGVNITSSGLLQGTPSTAGTYIFEIQAVDQQPYTTRKEFSITVAPAPATKNVYMLDPPTEGTGWGYQLGDILYGPGGTPVSDPLHGEVGGVGPNGELTAWNPSGTPVVAYYADSMPGDPVYLTGGSGSGAVVALGVEQ